MSKASNRAHRALVRLAHIEQYRRLGPLIGPKERHQPDPRWASWYRAAFDPDWSPGALTLGQSAWFTGDGRKASTEGEEPVMRHTMNRNLQVTREDYARCVKEQIDFLHTQDGSPDPGEWDTTDPDLAHDLRTFYDNSVSVDAAADDLLRRGF